MNGFDEHSFRLSKQQRTGVILLIGLLLLLILVWRIGLPLLYSSTPEKPDMYQSAWADFKSANLRQAPHTTKTESHFIRDTAYSKKNQVDRIPGKLFLFNPNTASEADLLNLGLPARTVRILLNYRKKGGEFFKKEDLKKIYTLSPEDYKRLEPYIQIPKQNKKDGNKDKKAVVYEKSTYKKTPGLLNLNEVDAETLVKLPGIGPVYAKRIIAFRNALGGFASIDQLKEVYGFPDSTYRKLKSRFLLVPGEIKKININEAGNEELYRQPYLRPYRKKILRLRKKKGKFKDIADIKQISLINDEIYRKIAPYLTAQ